VALDEPSKDDRIYEANGIKIVLDKKVRKELKGISISMAETILGKRVAAEDLYASKGSCC
jgi:Fe-S cluster assembly iron-binding protein IscA